MKRVLIGILVFFVLGFVILIMINFMVVGEITLEQQQPNDWEFVVSDHNGFIEDFEPEDIVKYYSNSDIELKLVGKQKYLFNNAKQPNIKEVDSSLFGSGYYAVLKDKKENVQYNETIHSAVVEYKNDADYEGMNEVNMTSYIEDDITYKYKFEGDVDKKIFEEVLDVEYGQYVQVDNFAITHHVKNVKDVFMTDIFLQGTKYRYQVYEKGKIGEDDYVGEITYFIPEYFVVYGYAN